MMEVLVLGKYPLYKYTVASLSPPTYNAALQVGNKYYTIKKRISYYIKDGKNVIKLPSKYKKMLGNTKCSRRLKKMFEKEKPKLKKEKHLMKFFESVNNQVSDD